MFSYTGSLQVKILQKVLGGHFFDSHCRTSEPRRHRSEMYASAIIAFGLVTTLTSDLWPWKPLQQLASCLINAQSLPAHRSAADDWQMIGHCPVPWAVPVPISLTTYAHFGARLSAFFYWTRCFENNVPFDNTIPIYSINLHWKLGLWFRLDSELHYFSILHGE